MKVESRKSKTESRESKAHGQFAFAGFSTLDPRRSTISGFTLIELLVVITILGILAALTVPALKNFGKSDTTLSASRQLLGDIGRARQLAMSDHTTVYMVFVPLDFWKDNPNSFLATLTPAQRTAATNLLDKQLSGYTFVSLRSLGDQPGQKTRRYLAPWQALPDGTFIATNKFEPPNVLLSSITQPLYSFWNQDYPHSDQNKIYGFQTNAIPFPTEDSPPMPLPCLAFNYAGQLTTNGVDMAAADEYIPLARGSVSPAIDPATRALQFGPAQVSEIRPNDSASISYNIIHIDRLTGRAILEYHKMQ